MIRELLAVVQPLLDRLDDRVRDALAAADPDVRARIGDLGRALVALAGEAAGPAPPPPAPAPPQEAAPPPTPPAVADGVVPPAPPKAEPAIPLADLAARLKIGSEPAHLPSPPEPARDLEPITDASLPDIAARCRVKAEGARWAAERQRRLKAGASFHADIEPLDRALFDRAKAIPYCFLWMNHRNAPVPADLGWLDDLAGCFEAAADAADLLADLAAQNPSRDELERALTLAAEAQSALRAAARRTGWPNPDADQVKLFVWVRETAADQQIYLPRFMREDRPADPAGWADLRTRIHQGGEGLRAVKDRERQRRKLFKKIQYHRKRIDETPGADHAADWETIARTAAELVDGGVPPSNVELRDLVLPIRDGLPADLPLPRGFELVLREIDRFRDIRAAEPPEEDDRPEEPIPEVRQAAELLRGRAVVLIGGEPRPAASEALTDALGLSELIWLAGKEKSYLAFEPHVARPDVAVVLLAIRWSSHGFSEVREFCDKYDKPLVHLPGGYGPNQVAYRVMEQVAGRLAAAAR